MTYAPASIRAAQVYLRGQTGLEWASLGIVGDENHHGGYHQGEGNVPAWDYSRDESPRDELGLTGAASALDIGNFSRLREFSNWLVAECVKGAADTRDIREVIYSPDGRTVKRWDRLGIRSTGDSSHLTHTHISYFRDSEPRDKVSLFKRFFENAQEEDMDTSDKLPVSSWTKETYGVSSLTVGTAISHGYTYSRSASDNTAKLLEMQEAVLQKLAGADTKSILDAINKRAGEEAARDAAEAERDAALLAEVRDLASGGATANEVYDLLVSKLTRADE